MHTDKNPMCTHCTFADAVTEFRESRGAADLVAFQRMTTPDDAYAYSDEQLVRMALLRGMAAVVIELTFEEEDPRVQVDMCKMWTDAIVMAQVARTINGGQG